MGFIKLSEKEIGSKPVSSTKFVVTQPEVIDGVEKDSVRRVGLDAIINLVLSHGVAEEFDTSKAYVSGDYVVYNADLYKFKATHAAGAWNAAHVDKVVLIDEVQGIVGTDKTLSLENRSADSKTVGDALTAVRSDLADAFSTSSAYAIGDIVLYQGLMYRFKAAHAAGAWNAAHVDQINVGDEIGDLKDALSDLYIETDTTLSVEGKPADAKAVGDELTDIHAVLGGTQEPVTSVHIDSLNLPSNGIRYTAGAAYKTDYIPIKSGRKCVFTITANRTGEFRFGFAESIPADRVDASYIDALSISGTGTASKEYTANSDGYVSVSYYGDLLNTLVVTAESDTIAEAIDSAFEEIESSLDERLETDKTLTVIDKAADAKTVGDALQAQNEYTYGTDIEKEITTVNNLNLSVDGVKYFSSNGFDTKYFPVASYETINVEITAARGGEVRFGFATKIPALNIPAEYLDRLVIVQNQKSTYSYIPTSDGFLSFSYYNNLISAVDISVKSGGANKTLKDNEADITTIYDVIDPIKTENDFIRTTTNHDTLRLLHAAKKKRSTSASVANSLALVHFSDIHGDSGALQRIMSDVEYLGLIDDVICTGDMVATVGREIESWWNPSVMTCMGNHDTATNSGGWDYIAIKMAERTALYIEPFESNWSGIVHEQGKSYYYKDYTSQKVRLIVLDCQLYQEDNADATAQHTWLVDLLSSAITGNLHVIIAIHGVYNGASVVACSFSSYGSVTMPGVDTMSYIPQSVVEAVSSAQANNLKFIGYICGHKHQDNIFKATETQLGFCITCAYSKSDSLQIGSDLYRSETIDAYNIVVIDTANTLVKLIRGGGTNVDVYMRPREAITFNYSTGNKIAEIL